MSLSYSNYYIYYFFLLFLYNQTNAQCTATNDAFTHKICYGKNLAVNLDEDAVKIYYDLTIQAFTPLQNYGHTYTGLDCEAYNPDPQDQTIPKSISLIFACFTCCIQSITSNVASTEYTQWRLLYHINNNIHVFATDLTSNSGTEVTHIYYASINHASKCESYPHICNYPLMTDFTLTLTLDTTNSNVIFQFSYKGGAWFGIGIGAISDTGYGIIASDATAGANNIAEWNVSHTIPSPTPTSNTAIVQSSQNLFSSRFDSVLVEGASGAIFTVTCSRSFSHSPKFTATQTSVTVYAAHGDGDWDVTTGHGTTNNDRVSPVDILIIPDNYATYWCTNITNCLNILNTSEPTSSPTVQPTKHPSDIPTKTPTPSPTPAPSPHPLSSDPTISPSRNPTEIPSLSPTASTTNPTSTPTFNPTFYPTENPTHDPTFYPTNNPTNYPTTDPTVQPTFSPTPKPTPKPIPAPKKNSVPTSAPITVIPSSAPTSKPTIEPPFEVSKEMIVYAVVGFGVLGILMIVIGGIQFWVDRRERREPFLGGFDIDNDGRVDDDQDVQGFQLLQQTDDEDDLKIEEMDDLDEDEDEEDDNQAMEEFMNEAQAELDEAQAELSFEVEIMQQQVNNDDIDHGDSDIDNL